MAHVRFHRRKRVHTRHSEKDRTQRLTRRNRGFPSLDHSAALCRQRNTLYSATHTFPGSLLTLNTSRRGKSGKAAAINFIPQPFFILLFNFSHKWPTFAFTGESGYTLGFPRKIAHSGLHAETGGVSDGVLLLPSDCFTRFGKPAWPGGRTANCAAFGSWPGALSKNAEGLRDSDALMRVAVPQASRPRWAA